MKNLYACITVYKQTQVRTFLQWLKRNVIFIEGISNNQGCGCCVDIFQIIAKDEIEEMPCQAKGNFEKAKLKFGKEKDAIISELILSYDDVDID